MTPELARYLEEAPAFHPLLPQALALDKVYIPTRYPDALPGRQCRSRRRKRRT